MGLAEVVADAGVYLSIVGIAALVAGLIYLRLEHRAHYGLGSFGETDPHAMANCPHCGARNDADRERCEYCSEPFDSDEGARGQSTEDDRWGAHECGE